MRVERGRELKMREEVEGALMGGGALCGVWGRGEIMRAWQVLDEPVALISKPNKIEAGGGRKKRKGERTSINRSQIIRGKTIKQGLWLFLSL